MFVHQEFNPNVAATFYWLPLRRQVRIEGAVTKISHEESEEYFHQRPRASQVLENDEYSNASASSSCSVHKLVLTGELRSFEDTNAFGW